MDNPAEVSDLESLWRPLTDQEYKSADALLGYAWRMLIGKAPTIEAKVVAGTLDIETVKYIVLEAVLRVLRNPNGHRQESQTIDDYTKSWVLDQAVSTGELYFSATQLRALGQTSQRGRAYTIITGG